MIYWVLFPVAFNSYTWLGIPTTRRKEIPWKPRIEYLQTKVLNVKIVIGLNRICYLWISTPRCRKGYNNIFGKLWSVLMCMNSMYAHLICFICINELCISVYCAGTVPPHKASGTCQHADCWFSSSSHWTSIISCHKERSAVTEGEPVRLCRSLWNLSLVSVLIFCTWICDNEAEPFSSYNCLIN